jgi:sugar lactone lactonase YvrE
VIAGVTMAATLAVSAAPAAAAETPWSCDAFGYLFQAPAGLPPGQIQQIDLATGAFTTAAPTVPSDVLNGVGYSPADNFFYAWDTTARSMVRINSDRTLTTVPSGTFPGGPAIGDVDTAGHYWAIGSDGLITEIDYSPGSATYGQVMRTVTLGAAPAGIINGGADWAWINGALYMIGNDAAGRGHLLRVDPSTGARTDLTPAGWGSGITGVGAVYADSSGYLYGSDNTSGAIWRVDTRTGSAIRLPTGPSEASNDGARCALAPIPTVTVRKAVDGRARRGPVHRHARPA